MSENGVEIPIPQSVSPAAARNLANTTKTVPQMVGISPRWLARLLPWVAVEAGTYRINRRRVAFEPDDRVKVEFRDGEPVLTGESLRALSILRNADESVLDQLASRFETRRYDTGQTVVAEGDSAKRFYIIIEGKVAITSRGRHGQPQHLAFLADGQYFGEMALLRGTVRNATVTTRTPCTIVALKRKDFKKLTQESPALREDLERVARQRQDAIDHLSEFGEAKTDLAAAYEGEVQLPETLVDYETAPREYSMSIIQTVLRVHTRVSDLYNVPHDQLREQIRLTTEAIRERQEWELINSPDFGLLNNAAPAMRIPSRSGPPTPDDMDDLLSKVWKQPAFFLAHPKAVAAFGRECTRRGVPPPTLQLYGSPFLTWRGVPIIPSNKIPLRSDGAGGKTSSIMLMRVGEAEQGVIGLHQPGLPGEQQPSLSVRFMGINRYAVASYLVTLYFSCAVLTDDALGVLEDVEVGRYHDYA